MGIFWDVGGAQGVLAGMWKILREFRAGADGSGNVGSTLVWDGVIPEQPGMEQREAQAGGLELPAASGIRSWS